MRANKSRSGYAIFIAGREMQPCPSVRWSGRAGPRRRLPDSGGGPADLTPGECLGAPVARVSPATVRSELPEFFSSGGSQITCAPDPRCVHYIYKKWHEGGLEVLEYGAEGHGPIFGSLGPRREGWTMRRVNRLLALGVLVGLLMLALPASAQQRISGGNLQEPRNPNIQGITEERGVTSEGDTLPFTGADITLFVVIGLAAIGTGAVIMRRSRPRPREG